jgi:GT2 family glycosyltransferase
MSLPTVTIVFLVYNRREELRASLRAMLADEDYPAELVDVIVVDNASDDDSAAMVEEEFPQVRLIRRTVNSGVSGWNDGFEMARGEYVLALDDDCYLPAGGLRASVEAAREWEADLVSFAVRSADKPDHRFDVRYRTGLLSFWGCAVLIRRTALENLRGYDPEIFVWANELEFMLRFFDRGYRHLHRPDLVAVHMKHVNRDWSGYFASRAYRVNARHFAYIAAKLFRPREALEALIALLALHLRDGLRTDQAALKAIPEVIRGFAHGLRHRKPLGNAEISRVYRQNFLSYASPWWLSRPLAEIVRTAPARVLGRGANGGPPEGRRTQYYAERARYYPTSADTLQF